MYRALRNPTLFTPAAAVLLLEGLHAVRAVRRLVQEEGPPTVGELEGLPLQPEVVGLGVVRLLREPARAKVKVAEAARDGERTWRSVRQAVGMEGGGEAGHWRRHAALGVLRVNVLMI